MKGWIIQNATELKAPLFDITDRKTMTIAITIAIVLIGIYLDYVAYKRIKSSSAGKYIRYSFLSLLTVSYLLIILTPFLMYFFINEQNCAFMMKLSMGMLTTYLALSIPRLLFYLFWLPTRRKCWLWVATTVSSALIITFIYSVFVTRTNYKVNKVELYYENLPDEFNGYRFAFISDIHTGSMVNPEKEINKISSIINSLDVDAIFFGGDIINVHHSELSETLIGEYSHFKACDGVFMVLGNHDTGAYIKNSNKAKREDNIAGLVSMMERAGWCVLKDSTVYIYRGNDSISVTGIDYNEELLEYKHSMDAVKGVDLGRIYNNVNDSVFNITLSHLPQLWYSICDGGFSDLTLSGHIHAMQMKFGSFSPARFMYKEWSGLYEREKGKLYINDGIGCVGYLARFGGARPEITLIELRRKE